MSYHSSSGINTESTSEVAYSSLDSCNTLSGGTLSEDEYNEYEDKSHSSDDILHPYLDRYANQGFPNTELLTLKEINQQIHGQPLNHQSGNNNEPLPKIS